MSETPIETDVVVVGSGVSGLAAALEAAQAGARVAVFEKQPSLGGTSNFFEGVFAVGSAMQKPIPIPIPIATPTPMCSVE
jgi:fumarate reductase flavoprotein subunit